jgi:tRNA modification GTPase
MIEKTTIFAISSGRPPAAIAVLRVTGSRAAAAVQALAGVLPAPRQATFATLRDQQGEVLDQGLVMWFPGPRSATGEDLAEFQIHGGRATITAVLAALAAIDGCRPAEAGEFTRRAFENGKIDLTAAEGLHDLLFAETEKQRRQSLRQMQGLLGHKANAWRRKLIEASALIEAGIDFADEGDVPADLIDPAFGIISTLHQEIRDVLTGSRHPERLRDGAVVAIAGPPNAGKSTLLNRLTRREAAIVSPYAGTTRDVIEVHLDLSGYPVTLLDTAGIRPTDDAVEQEGIRRAQERAASADLILWLVDCADADTDLSAPPSEGETPIWTVYTKTDLAPAFVLSGAQSADVFAVGKNGDGGLAHLISALEKFASDFFGDTESGLITRQRHRILLEEAAAGLAAGLAHRNAGEEIIAEDLRVAIRCLGRLLGKIDIEDTLDVIFREFCIGK